MTLHTVKMLYLLSESLSLPMGYRLHSAGLLSPTALVAVSNKEKVALSLVKECVTEVNVKLK